MRRILDGVTAWRDEHNIPVLLGEFGAYSRADMESRLRWTAVMVQEAEARDIGWCYWEFAAGFGIYNRQTKQFNDLYTALIPGE
jgi:endoglucanase